MCAWLALVGLAILTRLLLFPFVFADGEVRLPAAADEFYHLRRIWFTVVNFPRALDFDPYLNFPLGARAPWPPTFDWSIAAFARLVAGASQPRVEAVAVSMPPLFGVLTVIAAAALARRHFGAAAGWTSGVLLAVLPVHVFYSSLGALDHHVAVALLSVLLLGATMRVAGPADGRGWAAALAATALLFAGMLLLWPGSLLEILVVQLVLVAQVLLAPERSVARKRARGLAAAHAGAAALLAPFCLGQQWTQYGSLSPLVLTSFQPLWFACGAATLWIASALWRADRCGASRARRAASALAFGAGAIALAWLGVPGLAASVEEAASWFAADPFLARIAELRPLLFPAGRFEPAAGYVPYSHLFWIYPLAAGWLAWTALRERRAEVALLVTWSAAFLVAALTQRRFNDSAGPGFALVVGSALPLAWRAVRARLAPAHPRLLLASAALLLAAALAPSLRELTGIGRASLRLLRGLPVAETESPQLRKNDVLKRVARWLHEATPPTRGYLDPRLEPEYGVLSAWEDGHLLRYYAERPLVQDNFGPYADRAGFDAARAYFDSTSEEDALAIASRCRARYVVATASGSGQSDALPGSMTDRLAVRLTPGGGLALSPDGPGRHRLLYVGEDRARARTTGQLPLVAAVYEIVPGARVSGRAEPGTALRFELPLRLADGTSLLYVARAHADADGRYQVRLPHPTPDATQGGDGTTLRTATSYRVRASEREARLAVREADVREGRDVAGPSFAP